MNEIENVDNTEADLNRKIAFKTDIGCYKELVCHAIDGIEIRLQQCDLQI